MKLAKLAIISIGEKFRDDYLDEGNSLKNIFKKILFQRTINKACSEEPELAKLAFEVTDRVNRLQEQQADLDTLLNDYADSVSDTFLAVCPELTEPYLRVYRALARWTYYVDILCDFEEDCKKDAYNPLRKGGYTSLTAYLSDNYLYLLEKNREISREVLNSLEAVRSDRLEWTALYKIIAYSLNRVVPAILRGEDVTFHYFKELFKNRRRLREERRMIARKRKYEQG